MEDNMDSLLVVVQPASARLASAADWDWQRLELVPSKPES